MTATLPDAFQVPVHIPAHEAVFRIAPDFVSTCDSASLGFPWSAAGEMPEHEARKIEHAKPMTTREDFIFKILWNEIGVYGLYKEIPENSSFVMVEMIPLSIDYPTVPRKYASRVFNM